MVSMSHKSKIKKPKIHKIHILQASEINNYIQLKYQINCDNFWKWFFSECSWGDTNILSLDDENIKPEFKTFFDIMKEDFISDADEFFDLEIKNDL